MHHHEGGGPQGVAKKRQAANSEMRITNFHQTVGGQAGFQNMVKGLNSGQQSHGSLVSVDQPNKSGGPNIFGTQRSPSTLLPNAAQQKK